MQARVKILIGINELQNLFKVVITQRRTTLSLPCGKKEDGTEWYYDVSPSLEKKLSDVGVKTVNDWPHAGNGFTSGPFHTELWWSKDANLNKLFEK